MLLSEYICDISGYYINCYLTRRYNESTGSKYFAITAYTKPADSYFIPRGELKLIKYDDIYRNIAKSDIQGAVVKVSWKCPISDEIIAESSAQMVADKSLKGNMSSELTKGMINQAKGWFASFATSILGGQAGHTVRRMGTTLANHMGKQQQYGEEVQKEAIVKAFDKVKDKFVYSEDAMIYEAKTDSNQDNNTKTPASPAPPPIPGS